MELKLLHPNHDVTEIGCHCCSDQAQARLTIQQVDQWAQEHCPHHTFVENYTNRGACSKCWEELREMVK